MSTASYGEALDEKAVEVGGLEFAYGGRPALAGVSFSIDRGEIFGVLGPTGGGKTTLFRILSTAALATRGSVSVLGHALPGARAAVREKIGVVFQNPSLDGKLTVHENLKYHGLLYGLRGAVLDTRICETLDHLGVADRRGDAVETLSGGLARRVELAKGLLPKPRLLILDEPSTGLDPGARRDLWRYLSMLRAGDETTILVTTHLMEEAERCDRLAILDKGRVVCAGSPEDLKNRVGASVVTIDSASPESLVDRITGLIGARPARIANELRLETSDGADVVKRLMEAFDDEIDAIRLTKPSLEDVFVRETGHRFWNET